MVHILYTHAAESIAGTVGVPLAGTPAGGDLARALVRAERLGGRAAPSVPSLVLVTPASCAERALSGGVETLACRAVHVEPEQGELLQDGVGRGGSRRVGRAVLTTSRS